MACELPTWSYCHFFLATMLVFGLVYHQFRNWQETTLVAYFLHVVLVTKKKKKFCDILGVKGKALGSNSIL